VVTAAAVAALAWVEDASFEKTATAGSVSGDRAPAIILMCRLVLGLVCF